MWSHILCSLYTSWLDCNPPLFFPASQKSIGSKASEIMLAYVRTADVAALMEAESNAVPFDCQMQRGCVKGEMG